MDIQNESRVRQSILELHQEELYFFSNKVIEKSIKLMNASKGAESIVVAQTEKVLQSNEQIKAVIMTESLSLRTISNRNREKTVTAVILSTASIVVSIVIATALVLSK